MTTIGYVASSWFTHRATVRLPNAPEWFTSTQTANYFLVGITVNPGNSGGPVYSLEDASVLGVCDAFLNTPVKNQHGQSIRIKDNDLIYSSGLAVVVPIKFVIDLMQKHDLKWSSQDEH